jgi:2-polyprenyl-3-methyl-5-hydroxy-6-metoxy-1,4-benzoquinol methylase
MDEVKKEIDPELSASEEFQRLKYDNQWKKDRYAKFSPGLRSIGRLLEWVRIYEKCVSEENPILFAGSGSGHDAIVFHSIGLPIRLFDISANALRYPELEALITIGTLWYMPREWTGKFSFVWCADVLEHIPPSRVDESLHELRRVTKGFAMLQISLNDSEIEEHTGEPLHLTIRPQEWWRERVELARFSIINWVCDTRGNLFLYCEPK